MKKWFFCLVMFFGVGQVSALAVTNGLVVEPPMVNVVVDSGLKTNSFVIKYTNKSQSLLGLKLATVDFGALDESGGVAFLGLSKSVLDKKYSLASWVSLSENVVNLEPGTTKSVLVTILNKESLSPGGHYAAVLATLDQDVGGKNTVMLNQGMGTLIYASKKGGEKFDLKFSKLTTNKIWWSLTNNIEVRMQNQGNVHLVPRGVIGVFTNSGVEVARGALNSESSIIMPETYKWFVVKMKKNNRIIYPGKYQLRLEYRFDGSEDKNVKKIDFFYVGVEGLVLVGVIIIVLITILIRFILLI